MNAFSLWMIPLVFSSEAMCRVEYLGRSITKVWPDGSTGMSNAHANQAPKAQPVMSTSQKILRMMAVV
jgi:hypothetical protein